MIRTSTEKPPLSRIPRERELAILTFGGGWLLITLVIEALSYLRGLAPPDPNLYRFGLGIPALLLVAAMIVVGPRLDEPRLARGFEVVLFASLVMGWVIMLITPATYAVFFQLCTTLTATAFFADRRWVMTMAVGLTGVALLPAIVRLHQQQPHNAVAWLIVFLPMLWTGAAVVFARRAKLNEAIVHAQRLSLSDPLTGLANLRAVGAAFEADGGAEGGLLLIDLDNFKAANTLYGHAGGDHALRVVAQALLNAAGPAEIVARVGGDEMAVFAPNASAADLERLAVGYREAVRTAGSTLGLAGVTLDASVGVARRPADGTDLADLLTAADRSMYAVKATRHQRRGLRTPPAGTGAAPQSPAPPVAPQRRRGRAALAWAGVMATVSVTVVISVLLLPSSGTVHVAGTIAWGVTCLVVAAALAIVRPRARTLSRPPADVASAIALTLLLYLTGGLQSPALPLVLLFVMQQAVASPPRGVVWKIVAPSAIALSPLLYQHNLTADQWPQTIALLAACIACVFTCAVAQALSENGLGKVEAHARRLASTDPLTGLANRRAFTDVVEAALTAGERFAVVMIDLDDFADVNTTLGHQGGDLLLRDIAKALGAMTRSGDCLARIGGDEFAVLLPDVDDAAAHEIADRFLFAVRACAMGHEGAGGKVRASAGYALYPQNGRTLDELIGRADEALMEVKFQGKGRGAPATGPAQVLPT